MGPWLHVALVAGGSALGGLARWGVDGALRRLLGGPAFPWGTFFVNVSGCLFLGWLASTLDERFRPAEGSAFGAEEWRLLLGVGFAGAYTTFSTFEAQTYKLLASGSPVTAALYLGGSVALGFLAFRAGMMLAGA